MSNDDESQEDAMRALGYVTVNEAARRVRKSIQVIYRALDRGKLAGARVGAARYVSRESLDAYAGPLAVEPAKKRRRGA